MKIRSVQTNPYLNIDRIEFIITYRCNSHCQHCYVRKDQRLSIPNALKPEMAVDFMRQVTQEYTPQSVMTFGGEPLLYPETICAIHQAARDSGIRRREVITNGGWPREEAAFRRVALRLASSGINHVALSTDVFHQEYVPISILERNAKLLLEAGIPHLSWNPCWVIDREHSNKWNQSTKEILKYVEYLPIPESEGNIMQPAGNALKRFSDFLPARTAIPKGSCEDVPYASRLDHIRCLSLEPNGDVEVCKEVVIGNTILDDIPARLRSYNPYSIPSLKAILEGGINRLGELARTKGIVPDPEGYYSICDMCVDLRRQLQAASR
jgi:hypothetical protein